MKCYYCSSKLIDEIDENYRRVWRYLCKKCDLYYSEDPAKRNKILWAVPDTKSGRKIRESRQRHKEQIIYLCDKPAPYCLVKFTNQIKVDEDTHNLFIQERNRLNAELKGIGS